MAPVTKLRVCAAAASAGNASGAQARHGELAILPARLCPFFGPRIGGRDAPEFERRRPQAVTEYDARGLRRRMGAEMSADRGAGGRADRGHPARIFLRRVLRLLVHRVGIARGDERQRIVAIDPRDRHFVSDAAEMDRHAVSQRSSNAIAHLDMITTNRNATVRAEFYPPERGIPSGAVALGDAGDAGADQDSAVLQPRFLLRTLPPDRMHFELVENLGRANGGDIRVAHHGPAIRLQRIAPPKLDRIERQRRCRFIDQYLERRQSSAANHSRASIPR